MLEEYSLGHSLFIVTVLAAAAGQIPLEEYKYQGRPMNSERSSSLNN